MYKFIFILIVIFSLSINISHAEIVTPQDLEIFYSENISYETDIKQFKTKEYYQKPLELHKNKKGDCEDYSLHAYTVLDYNGYKVYMYSIFFKDSGHVVTVFKQFGYYHVFDTGYTIYTNEKYPTDAVKKLYPKWRVICIFKPIKYGKINLANHLLSHKFITGKL